MSTAEPVTLPWSRVQHTAERVAVVGSGPSLRDVDLRFPEGVTVIAVNAAIAHLPEPPDFWFTLDLSKANRALIADPRPGTVYYAAAHPGPEELMPSNHRRPTNVPHVIWLQRIHGKHARTSRAGLSVSPTGIHAGNSGYGALNLAFLMGARRIALFGIDGGGGYAWGKAKPGDLHHLPWLFTSAANQLEAKGVEVVNGSPASLVRCWPRMTPQEAMAWLAR